MTKPEILGSLRSTYTRVVRMVCEEKGIDYILTETLRGAPELRRIHPFGKMPVLRDGDFELCESKAIATYLDRRFPGPQLIPDDPRLAALTEQWVSLVNTIMDATLIRTYLFAYAMPKTADGTPDQSTIEAVTPAVRTQLAVLDHAVAATGYLVGDKFTLADINLMPILYYIRQMPEGAAALALDTRLGRYYACHAARASFERTMPPAGPPKRAAN
ncbi:MAG TPA: glutathione S-transferase family protein [Bradyrhizobium sp.]|nr:glutathione S-transferase family protein [Bradyrhizobium sp.]